MVLIKKRIVVADGNMSPDILWKVLNKQPAVHGGEKTIEDIGEVEDKDCDDAEPLQVDLEPPVEAEEAEVDDHVRERHYAIVWKRDIVRSFCNKWQNV